jgi:predicted dehydrogenase
MVTPQEKNSRRDFIQKSGFIAGGMAIGLSPLSYGKIIGANDRVNVGIVGFAVRSKQSLIPGFMNHARELNMEIIALSDIWKLRREEGQVFLKETTGRSSIAMARNNEELYANKNVDAVIIATADFQHALHGIEAVMAGRDAYIEKPLANTMEDAKAILKAVEDSNKIVQIGTQRRSGWNYKAAENFIKSGKFGKVNLIELTWNVHQPGRWRLPDLVRKCKEEDTDWKRFLMNRPQVPFDPRKCCEYRLFWPYSSGIPDQWMVHQIDTVHWFSGLYRPRSVVANGGIYQWNDGRANYDTMTAVFDYGDLKSEDVGFQVVYTSRLGNSAGGIKEHYFSNGGMLNLETNQVSSTGGLDGKMASATGLEVNLLENFSLSEAIKGESGVNTGADPLTSAHMRTWMECIRSRKQPNADVRAGYNHFVTLCMTIAALQSGKKVTFNDEKQEVIMD